MPEINGRKKELATIARYRAAARLAAVAGAFSLIVAALMLWSEFRGHRFDPVNSEQIPALKARFSATDDKDERNRISREIRELDLRLRHRYFRSIDFSRRGRYLLAGGVAVFLVGLGYAVSCRENLPMPGRRAEGQTSRNAEARLAVGAVGVLLACVWVVLAIISRGPPGGYAAISAEPVGTTKGQTDEPVPIREEVSVFAPPEEMKKNWPRFRGPGGLGISAYTNVPASWDGKTGEGILWKSKVSLPGENSPVVWGSRVFVTGADADRREVYCFDAGSGEMVWHRPVTSNAETPEVSEDTGYAAPTAATDGRRIYAVFATGNVVSFDFSGERVWARALGVPDNAYGHASSPTTWKNLLLVLVDQGYSAEDGNSALYALDSRTGKTVWEAPRPVPGSWTSPIVIDTADGEQIITCASPWVIAYDPETGAELWRADCLSGDVAPSPVFVDGLIYVCQEYSNVAAIRTGGEDDVSQTHVVWKKQEGLPDTCSPLCDGKLLFLVNNFGTVTCYDALNGEMLWEKEFETEFNSSPSLVGTNVYLMDTHGVMHIFEAARKFKEVGKAELGEPANSSPAFLDGRIYIRGKSHLYCIGIK